MPDTIGPANAEAFREACRPVVRTLIQTHRWTLIPEEALLDLAAGAAPATPPSNLESFITALYTTALYEACRQTVDSDRRERAYTDLFHYLYRIAYNRWRELAEDIIQRALELVYKQIDRCEHPAAFLAFATFKLRHAAQQEQRPLAREAPELDSSVEHLVVAQLADKPAVLVREQWHILWEALGRLSDERKRAVVVLRYFGELSDKEIARHLDVKPSYVAVLRFNALRQLRSDQQLRDYFEPPEHKSEIRDDVS